MKNIDIYESIANLDAYGSKVELQFKNRKNHPTTFGGLITMINAGFLIFVAITYGSSLFDKSKPNIVFSEEYTQSPEMYNMTESTFSIAFGMQDHTFSHYIDETIYSIQVLQQVMIKKFNQTTQEYDSSPDFIDLNVHPCKLENFKVPDTEKFYDELIGLDQMYCFDQKDNKAWIAGDFISDIFGSILIQVNQCTNKTEEEQKKLISEGKTFIVCKSQDIIDGLLAQTYFAAYYTDKILQPKNLESPFQTITRDIFWPVSNKIVKEITMYFRNIYFESDVGLMQEDVQIKRDVVFSYSTEQVKYGLTSQFITIYLRFEKLKQSRYFRSYLKIEDVLAQISGVMDLIVIISSFICLRISGLDLSKSLVNEVFSFYEEYDEQQKQQKLQEEEVKQKKDETASKVIRRITEQLNSSKRFQQFHQQNQVNDEQTNKVEDAISSDNKRLSQSIKKKQHSEILSKFIRSYKQTLTSQIQKDDKDEMQYKSTISKLFQVSNQTLQLKVYDYILYYVFPRWNKIARKKKQIDYSQKLLNKHLDVMYIVNKLQEIDKLKMLLLSEDQIKLFNYLPKPSIKIEDVIDNKGKKELNQQKNIDQDGQNDSIYNQSQRQIEPQSKYSYLEKFNMLYMDERSDIDKASDAYSSFEKMRKLKNRSTIDTKLLLMLDPKILDFFLDEGEIHSYHENVKLVEEVPKGGLLRNKVNSIFKKNQLVNVEDVNFLSQNSPMNQQQLTNDKELYSTSRIFNQDGLISPREIEPIIPNVKEKQMKIEKVLNKNTEINEQQNEINGKQQQNDSDMQQQEIDIQMTPVQIQNFNSEILIPSESLSPTHLLKANMKDSVDYRMFPSNLKQPKN